MRYARRYRRPRRAMRPRRSYRKKRYTRRAYNRSNRVVSSKERYLVAAIASNTGVAHNVSLDEIPAAQYAAYVVLYRSFKITGVRLTLIPDYSSCDYNHAINNVTAGSQFGGQMRLSLIKENCRDLIAPSSEADALESQNCITKCMTNGRPFSIYIKNPHFQVDVEAGTEVTYKTGWLSTSTGFDVHHNVAAWWMASEGSGSNPYRVLVTQYLKFKDPQ